MSRALTVGGVDGREVEREVSQRAVAGGGAGRARRLDDLQHHRLAVVTHRHLHAAQPLRSCRRCCAAPVPSPGYRKNKIYLWMLNAKLKDRSWKKLELFKVSQKLVEWQTCGRAWKAACWRATWPAGRPRCATWRAAARTAGRRSRARSRRASPAPSARPPSWPRPPPPRPPRSRAAPAPGCSAHCPRCSLPCSAKE